MKSNPGSTTELGSLDPGLEISLKREVFFFFFAILPKEEALTGSEIIDYPGVEIINDLSLFPPLSLSPASLSFWGFSTKEKVLLQISSMHFLLCKRNDNMDTPGLL